MARTDLTVTQVTTDGVDPASTAGTVDGHMFRVSGQEIVEVENADASARTVTIQVPVTIGGQDVEDEVVSIPAGGRRIIGPLAYGVFARGATDTDAGKVYIDYEVGSEAQLSIRAFRV